MTAYELQIEGATYTDQMTLSLGAGKLTSRTFDAQGGQTGASTQAF